MTDYLVRYDGGHNSDGIPLSQTERVTAYFYATQATNGAGMIADFYATEGAIRPTHTFSKVISVQKLEDEGSVTLTADEAEAVYTSLKFGSMTTRLTEFFDSAIQKMSGTGGIGAIPWAPWKSGDS